jgi:hypothetical protein
MKMSGNRIRFEKIITFGGVVGCRRREQGSQLSAGELGEDERKDKHLFMTATGTKKALATLTSREIPVPKIAPATTSPRMMPKLLVVFCRDPLARVHLHRIPV